MAPLKTKRPTNGHSFKHLVGLVGGGLIFLTVFFILPKDFSHDMLRASSTLEFHSPHENSCGEWTPHGDPANIHFPYARYDTQKVVATLNTCPNSSVGQEIQIPVHRLYCHPNVSTHGRARPVLALEIQRSSITPEYSIISPSHNVAPTFQDVIPLLCRLTRGAWEAIFILDGSMDNSLHLLREVLLSKDCMGEASTLVRVRVVIQPTGVFETSSDNIGFVLATASHFIIEVQADMILQERGWNQDLARPFFEYNDIFSISGRCGHSQGGGPSYSFGRCNKKVRQLDLKEQKRMKNAVYVTATNNRGPLIFRVDALAELGYLNEINFYLGDDDHDINRRAQFHGWTAAYKYVHFYSPANLSTQRNPIFETVVPESVTQYNKHYRKYREKLRHTRGCEEEYPALDAFSPERPKTYKRRLLPPSAEASTDKDTPLPPLPPLARVIKTFNHTTTKSD